MTPFDPLAAALSGTQLIEASAGTGKTHTITTLYLRLLLEARRAVGEILVVTYTNAATAELRSRMRARLHAALAAFRRGGDTEDETLDRLVGARRATAEADCRTLTDALYAFDEAAIFTIHGFCQRVLYEHAFESGVPFDVELLPDQTALVDEVAHDFWASELYRAPATFVRHVLGGGSMPSGLPRGRTPQELAALAEKVTLHGDAPVLGVEAAPDLAGAEERWREAHDGVRALWRAGREEILARLIRSCAGLKKIQYRAEDVPAWGAELDRLLSPADPRIGGLPPCFEKFTAASLARGRKKDGETPSHPFFTACDALWAAEENLQHELDLRLGRFDLDLVAYARRELKRRKDAARTRFFDDLLADLDRALGGPGGQTLATKISSRFRAALIDEFQDTDPVQYRIFRRVYGARPGAVLFLIGDPKQAIYAFRGADVFAYIAAKRDAGPQTATLDTNWRADPGLIRALNTLFDEERNPSPFVLREIRFRPARARPGARDVLGGGPAGRAPFEVLFVPRAGREGRGGRINKGWGDRELPAWVAAEIARFLASGACIDGRPLEASDVTVLCRTNQQAARMQAALRALDVPTVLRGEASVFDAPEAEEFERVLAAMAEPGNAGAVRAALATSVFGLSARDLLRFQEDEGSFDPWVNRFTRWHGVWLESGFLPAFRRLLDESEVGGRLLELRDGERRLTNLLHLGELLQTAAREAPRGPLALVEWFAEMRADARTRARLVGEAAQIRLESDARALQLTTVHKSKGLQYPIVYCPFLWDGGLLSARDRRALVFHDPADGDRLKIDLGSPRRADHERWAETEALAESRRLLYVALTRAKHRCTVVWGAFNESEHSALANRLHPSPGSGAGDGPARLAGLDDDEMRAELELLAQESGGTIEVRELGDRPVLALRSPTEGESPLGCRTARRTLSRFWRTGSFSSLTAGGERVSARAEEGADDDEAEAPEVPLEAGEGEALVLHDFPAWARAGQLIHRVLEELDFAVATPASIGAVVAESLREYGFDSAWAEVLGRGVDLVLDTPLGGGAPPNLRSVARERRMSEMEFLFPVAAAGRGALSSEALAALLARHDGARDSTRYADRVRDLGFTPLAGFLRGYIDLVFEHDGRWFVVDYKSNHLGARPEDYGAARLGAVMEEHHYLLQAYLYVVAVHRYLGRRLAGYDYERDFGGVLYLFVRGMSPRHAPGIGVYRQRPPFALVDALSRLVADPGAGERS